MINNTEDLTRLRSLLGHEISQRRAEQHRREWDYVMRRCRNTISAFELQIEVLGNIMSTTVETSSMLAIDGDPQLDVLNLARSINTEHSHIRIPYWRGTDDTWNLTVHEDDCRYQDELVEANHNMVAFQLMPAHALTKHHLGHWLVDGGRILSINHTSERALLVVSTKGSQKFEAFDPSAKVKIKPPYVVEDALFVRRQALRLADHIRGAL